MSFSPSTPQPVMHTGGITSPIGSKNTIRIPLQVCTDILLNDDINDNTNNATNRKPQVQVCLMQMFLFLLN